MVSRIVSVLVRFLTPEESAVLDLSEFVHSIQRDTGVIDVSVDGSNQSL